MALATLADIRRYLPGVVVEDPILQALLDGVTEWLEEWANANWDASGAVTENFYNVREGSVLKLKDVNPSSVTVNTYLTVGSSASALTEDSGFIVMDRGKIQLRVLLRGGRLQGLRPEELDAYEAGALVYVRVEVGYTASGVVPKPVREAVAMTVAARYVRAKADVAGVKSERLGDYSYTKEGAEAGGVAGVPSAALAMLEPYRRHRHAVSV